MEAEYLIRGILYSMGLLMHPGVVPMWVVEGNSQEEPCMILDRQNDFALERS